MGDVALLGDSFQRQFWRQGFLGQLWAMPQGPAIIGGGKYILERRASLHQAVKGLDHLATRDFCLEFHVFGMGICCRLAQDM